MEGPFLVVGARRSAAGVNLERPQAQPRTNEVDAGEYRRRLSGLNGLPDVVAELVSHSLIRTRPEGPGFA
jgi:hypothetical protein